MVISIVVYISFEKTGRYMFRALRKRKEDTGVKIY